MKVGILHLSDIHIEDGGDWIIGKGEKIAQAVLGTWEELGTLFVVVTGDRSARRAAEQSKSAPLTEKSDNRPRRLKIY